MAWIRLFTLSLAYITNIIYARFLGVGEYGVLSYMIAWVGCCYVVGTFGFDLLLVRKMADYNLNKSWAKMSGLLNWSHKITLLTSLAVMLFFICWFMLRNHGYISYIPASCCMLFFLILMRVSGSALVGLHRVHLGQIAESLIHPFLAVFLVVAAKMVLHQKIDVVSILVFSAIAAGAAWLFNFLNLYITLPENVSLFKAQYFSKSWIAEALPIFWVGALNVINSQICILVLGNLSGNVSLGLYSVADKLAMLVSFPLSVVNLTLAPTFASLFAAKQYDSLQVLVSNSVRLASTIALIIAIIMIFTGHNILLLFGKSFDHSYIPLLILCVGQVINTVMGSVGYLLIMTGHGKQAVVGIVAGVITNLSLCLLMIPKWHETGAAFASVAGLLVWNVVLAVFVWKYIGISSTVFGKIRH